MTTDAELLAEAEGVLRAVEWKGRTARGWSHGCPSCGAWKYGEGHNAGCELYRVLGRLAGRLRIQTDES